MIVLDTNVLVRLITKDDIEQTRQAAALLSGPGPFWVSRVVLLETAWVLRSQYGYDHAAIVRALGIVVALPRMEVEDRDRCLLALSLHRDGMDLGDAMIAAHAPDGAVVASFDGTFVRRARKAADSLGAGRVRALGELLLPAAAADAPKESPAGSDHHAPEDDATRDE